MGFCLMGFCQGRVLSDGVLSGWGFVSWGFVLVSPGKDEEHGSAVISNGDSCSYMFYDRPKF